MRRAPWLAAVPALVAGAAAAQGLGHPAAGNGLSFLGLGFVIGIGHALESDHIAAVATMIDRREGRLALALRGAVWGLGHTLSLLVICTAVVVLGLTISSGLESALEFAVGVMIVALGLRVLYRLRRDRVHLHVHEHDGERHLHLHSHAGERRAHARSAHDHRHRRGTLGTLGIGLMHGAAGSAGLVVLSVAAADTTLQAVGYFVLFGLGTTFGMTMLTTLASYPLDRLQRGAAWMRSLTSAAIATLALVVGARVAWHSWPGIGLF